MKKTDDVFFFTLIDFLVQVFFFGLLLFVLAQAKQAEQNKKAKQESTQVQAIKHATGVSNLTELTDYLTKLAPIRELRGISDFIRSAGGIEQAKKSVEVVANAGGATNVVERLEKLKRLEEGSGKPPCNFTVVGNRKIPVPVATVVATDTTIRFKSKTAEFEEILKLLGRPFESIAELSHKDFRESFSSLDRKKPDCRFWLQFEEETNLVFARDAVRSTFYFNIVKKN